jgi:hypothetical protein
MESQDQVQPKQIELGDAYRETCTALGEAVTMQRLLQQTLGEAQMRIATLEAEIAAASNESSG